MVKEMLASLSFLLALTVISGCNRNDGEDFGGSQIDKWDPANVPVLGVGVYNYTDYDIYDVFLLPVDKNDIQYAADTSGARATRPNATSWDGGLGGTAAFAWDMKWSTPKRIKVWWYRVVDEELYDRSGPYPKDGGMFDPYDKYTVKETRPGAAWCEGEIVIDRPPEKRNGSNPHGSIVLHFYPDGRIEGEMPYFMDDNVLERVDIAKRNAQPVLKDRPCLKQINNPYFGKKRSIIMN